MGYLAKLWCKAMHRSLMWPSHGHYQCCTCGREYPVPWERAVTNTLWRQRSEKVVCSGIRLDGRSIAHAAQVIRPS
jgi:hypothetical protein